MADQIQNVTIKVLLQDLASGGAGAIERSITGIGAAVKGVTGLISQLGGPVTALLSTFGALEVIRKSLDAARQSTQATAQLTAALGASAGQLKTIQGIVSDIASATTFSNKDLTSLAAQLVNRGVPISQLGDTLKAVTQTAAALNLTLDQAGDAVAASFGGKITRELSRAVPQLKSLTEAELAQGAAVDLLNKRFAGQAQALANTPFGKAQQQSNQLELEYEHLGDTLVNFENKILPEVIKLFDELNTELDSPAGQAFLSLVTKIITGLIQWSGTLAAVGAGYKTLSAGKTIIDSITSAMNASTSATTKLATAQNVLQAAQKRQTDLIATGVAKEKELAAATREVTIATEAQTAATEAANKAGLFTNANRLVGAVGGGIAGGAIGYQVGGTSGAVIGTGIGAAALSGGGTLATVAAAAAVADALYIVSSRLLGINTDFDSLSKQINVVIGGLGALAKYPSEFVQLLSAKLTDFVGGHLPGALGDAIHAGAQASADDAIATAQGKSNKEADQKINTLITQHNQKLSDNRRALLAQLAALTEEFDETSAASRVKIEQQANEDAYKNRVITLQQYLDKQDSLERTSLEANIAELQKQVKIQETVYNENFKSDDGQGAAVAALQKLIDLGKILLPLKQQLADLDRQSALNALAAANQAAQRAQEELNKAVERNIVLVQRGTIQPEQGQQQNIQALIDYQKQIEQVNAVLEKRASEYPDVAAAAKKSESEIAQSSADMAAKAQDAFKSVRPVMEAVHQGALQLQNETTQATNTLFTDLITGSKSASQAFGSFLQAISSGMLNLVTSRLAEQFVGLLSGGTQGGGLFGAFSKTATQGVDNTTGTAGVGGVGATGILGLIGGIFGGLFANGGRPPVGIPSIVGENGPELFVPDSAGQIVPSHNVSDYVAQHFASRGIGQPIQPQSQYLGDSISGVVESAAAKGAGAGSSQPSQTSIVPVMVNDEANIEKLLNGSGGKRAMLKWMASNRQDSLNALGVVQQRQ